MSVASDFEPLPQAGSKGLVIALLEKVAALERTVTALRDEIARLKNVPGGPVIKPGGMDNATQPKPPAGKGSGRKSGGKKTARRVAAQLRGVGVDISRRQGMRLLIAGQGGFLDEAQDVLRAGLTIFATLDRRLKRLHANKPELLMALDRPGFCHCYIEHC